MRQQYATPCFADFYCASLLFVMIVYGLSYGVDELQVLMLLFWVL